MIIDLRYHIASLVAVFLALAVGIAVGSVMLGNDSVVWQQEKLADSLETELRIIRQDNQQLRQKVSAFQNSVHKQGDFEQVILAQLVKQRLEGMQVAVIDTTNTGLSPKVVEILQLAGAKIAAVINIQNGLGAGGESRPQRVKEYLGLEDKQPGEVVSELAHQLGRGIYPGDNLAVLNLMAQEGLIKISGEMGVPVNAVVVIGGSQEIDGSKVPAKLVDVPLLKYLTSKGLKVYGVEEVDTAISYMPIYQRLMSSTVDNIDTIPGQVSFVWAMEGKSGYYGVKSTAKRFMPEEIGGKLGVGGKL
ncbi:MAG: copper transporter [Carboxydocellales bacterium]